MKDLNDIPQTEMTSFDMPQTSVQGNINWDQMVDELFQSFIKSNPRHQEHYVRSLLEHAFQFARHAHRKQNRKSGEPYITHPLEVARIVSNEIGLDLPATIAAFLHDVVEDTEYTLEDIQREFGDEVAYIIDNLTKITEIYDEKVTLQRANFIRLFETIPIDLRVIFIKIADRLHNLRTMGSMKEETRRKKVSETLYVYAPLAFRLGLHLIKKELEDVSFWFLDNDEYQKTAKMVEICKVNHESIFFKFKKEIEQKLGNAGYEFVIYDKRKSIYSINNDLQRKSLTFDKLHNYISACIVFKANRNVYERPQCYDILQIITSLYPLINNTLYDWVDKPRATRYEAVHFCVMGPEGVTVEVHVLTERMQIIANHGYAHIQNYRDINETPLGIWVKTFLPMVKNQDHSIDDLVSTISLSDIKVYTPKGEMNILPIGASILDFAFHLNTLDGHRCIGGEIDNKLFPANTVLKNGDRVKIITAVVQNPEQSWINAVITPKAKTYITQYLKKDRQDAMVRGQKIFDQILRNANKTMNDDLWMDLQDDLQVENIDDLATKLGRDVIREQEVIDAIRYNLTKRIKRRFSKRTNLATSQSQIFSSKSGFTLDTSQPLTCKFAQCRPIPGDNATALNTEYGIVIHKSTCPAATQSLAFEAEKTAKVHWIMHRGQSFSTCITIKGFDRKGIAFDIINIISANLKINLREINFTSNDGFSFSANLELMLQDLDELDFVMSEVKRIEGVNQIDRVVKNCSYEIR